MRSLLVCVVMASVVGCAGQRTAQRDPVAPGTKPEPPPGFDPVSGHTQIDILSDHPSYRWDLLESGDVVCATPCRRWVDLRRPLFLQTEGRGRQQIWVDTLYDYQGLGALELRARTVDDGAEALGIVFTTFGGMATVTGGILWIIGAAAGEDGMNTAGMITTLTGALVTAGAIRLLIDSAPHVEIYAVRGDERVRVAAGPFGVHGSF